VLQIFRNDKNTLPIFLHFLYFSACHDKKEKPKHIQESITQLIYTLGIIKSKNHQKLHKTYL
jgi:hypothetical protein